MIPSYSQTRILTRRLIIRPYRPSDFHAWQEGHLTGKGLHRGRISRSSFKSDLEFYRAAWKADLLYKFGIFEKKSGRHIGYLDIATHIRLRIQSANLGYEIHRPFWRQGFCTEACIALLRFCFQKLHFHRIEACADKKNLASVKTALAIGMKREGPRRQFYFNSDKKRWIDDEVFGAYPEDFGLRSKAPTVRLSLRSDLRLTK